MTTKNRIYSFTLGAFQVTVFPPPPSGHGAAAFTVDLYHSGTTYTQPRFICTREEVDVLAKLAAAADSLVSEYLAQGRSFEEWCAAHDVNPFDPDLTS